MYFSLSEVTACVNYKNSTLEPSEFSTCVLSTGLLLCCAGVIYCPKMEGLLSGPVRARLPGALNLARAWESSVFFRSCPWPSAMNPSREIRPGMRRMENDIRRQSPRHLDM